MSGADAVHWPLANPPERDQCSVTAPPACDQRRRGRPGDRGAQYRELPIRRSDPLSANPLCSHGAPDRVNKPT